MSHHATILVFLKYPQPGRVKTRLAAVLGTERAADLYRHWIGLVLGKLQVLRPKINVIGYFDGGPPEAFWDWRHLVDTWWPQPEGDLGERLQQGFEIAHAAGLPVLAIGTDCLEIEPNLLIDALAMLHSHDAVFGPTPDGGYYLVGTAQPLPDFFTGIRWSSEHTLADHLTRCRECHWAAGLLPLRHDIDTWDDWQAFLRRQGGER